MCPLTQVDALSSSQFRLKVVVVVAAPVIPAPFRGVSNEQVGTVGTENETVLQRGKKQMKLCVCVNSKTHSRIIKIVLRRTRCCSSVVWEMALPLTMTFDPATGVSITRRCSFLNKA